MTLSRSRTTQARRRAAEQRRYLKRSREWLQGKSCARCGTTRGLSCHHAKGRRGALLLAEEFWVALCGSGTTGCHGHVHAHPGESYERGWMLRRVAS